MKRNTLSKLIRHPKNNEVPTRHSLSETDVFQQLPKAHIIVHQMQQHWQHVLLADTWSMYDVWFLFEMVMFRYEEVAAVGAVEDLLALPSVKVEPPSRKQSVTMTGQSDVLPQFVYDTRIDPKMRARMIENEMNEQAQLVQDLYQLRASRNTIEMEERKLHDLQVCLTLYVS